MKQYIRLLCSLMLLSGGLYAQQGNLDELRQAPPKNALPVKDATQTIKQVSIPAADLDLRVNYWRHWTTFGINANQASFSDNWNNGGVNSIAFGTVFNHKADFTKASHNFVSEIDLKYGKLKNKEQLPRKNNDRIFWDNKFSLKMSKSWSVFTSLTFESQFDLGYKYGKDADGKEIITDTISRFMAPGYLTESLGIEYKPDATFSLRFGTGTARQTFVLDDELSRRGAFGVEAGKKFRNELAFQLVGNLDRNLSPSLNLKSRYAFFANYTDLDKASHRLDATLTARVSRVINVTLNGIVLYDENMDPGVQTSQTMALGLIYKFPR